MELTLPIKQGARNTETIHTNILVVIGTNGVGKSSFGRDLLDRYPNQSERISGLHALFINSDNTESPGPSFAFFKSILKERISVPVLSDYEKLILQLQYEEYEAAVNFKERYKENKDFQPPVTKLDYIQKIWEKMFPHNQLVRKSGFIEVRPAKKNIPSYTAGRMSDSEKLVFYLVGAILCAKPNALLIIDEPETLLHNCIKNQLWDEIEDMRPDCTFVYLTHDIEFAASRNDSKRIWLRSFNAEQKCWDYDIIGNNEGFPEELYMEILGSRKPILFIEGTDSNSIDSRLYPLIYPDYMVKPMGGCQKVIETTKAFGELKDFHNLKSMGIVDRDRRTEGEIKYLRSQNIFVPDVAEVENLLMLEDVIKTVAGRLLKDPEEVFSQTKENVIRLFEKELDSQTLLHAKHLVRKKLEMAMAYKINSCEELTAHVESIRHNINAEEIYNNIKEEFKSYIDNEDYSSILRVYNQKGMLPQSRLCSLCGISNKENYLNLILSLLKSDDADGQRIRNCIRCAIGSC